MAAKPLLPSLASTTTCLSALFNPTGSAVLDLINSKVVTGSGTPGVFLNVNSATPESLFTRSGNSLNVYSSN